MFTVHVGKEPHRLLEAQLTLYNIRTLAMVSAPTLRNVVSGSVVGPDDGHFRLDSAEGAWVVEGPPFAVAADKAQAKQQHNAWLAAKSRLIKKLADEQKEGVGQGVTAVVNQPSAAPPQLEQKRPLSPSPLAAPAPPVATEVLDEVPCPQCKQPVPKQNLAIHQLRCRPVAEQVPLVQQQQPQQQRHPPDSSQRAAEAQRLQALAQEQEREALRAAAVREMELQRQLVEKKLQADEEQQKLRALKAAEQKKILQQAEERQRAEARRDEEEIRLQAVMAAAERNEIRRQHEKKAADAEAQLRAKTKKGEEEKLLQQQLDLLKRQRQAEVERIDALVASQRRQSQLQQQQLSVNAGQRPGGSKAHDLAARPRQDISAYERDLAERERALVSAVERRAPLTVAAKKNAGAARATAPVPPAKAAMTKALPQHAGAGRGAAPRRGVDPDLMSDEVIARMLQKEYEEEAVANDALVAQALQERPSTGGARGRDDGETRRRQIEADERLARHLAEQLDDY